MVGVKMGADQQVNIARSQPKGCQLMHHKIFFVHAYADTAGSFVGPDHLLWPTSINEDIGPVAGLNHIPWHGDSMGFIASQFQKVESERGGYRCMHS